MRNELLVIENLELVPFFTKGESLDSVLEQIEKEAMSFVAGDLSIKKNRDAVKAMVTKVTKSKTYLESHGKDLATEYKEIPRRIDANRKKTRDFLTELQAKVRQPLTEWEEEEARIKAEEAAAVEAEKLRIQIESDHEIALLMDEKFNRELADKLAEEKRIEEERQAQIEKERAEREVRIAEEAKIKAEQEAKLREESLERERLAAIEREEQAKREAIAAEERVKAQAEEAERQRVIAEEKAKRDAKEAAERAKQAEIDRQKKETERLKQEADKKAADRKHAGLIHSQMVDAFVLSGMDKESATQAVTAMAKCLIPNVKINY
jgi:hypothetical protein